MPIIECSLCAIESTFFAPDGTVVYGKFSCPICDGKKRYDDTPPEPSPEYDLLMEAIGLHCREWRELASKGPFLMSELTDVMVAIAYQTYWSHMCPTATNTTATGPWAIRGLKAMRAALEAAERAVWQPIATAPKDRTITVFAAPYDDLPGFVTSCRYHEDAGFCVDELREVTHWRPRLLAVWSGW